MSINKIKNLGILDSAVTTAKIADSAVTTAKIADDAVTSAKIADSAVTNDMLAGSIANAKLTNSSITLNGSAVSLGGSATVGDVSNMVQLATTTLSGTATGWNGIFTSSYDNYMIQFDNVGSTATGTQVLFKFYNETGATSDNVYRGRTEIYDSAGIERSQNYQNAYPKFTSNMDGNSTGTGMNLQLFINQPLNATVQTQYSYLGVYGRTDGNGAYIVGGGVTTDYATREHTGLYIFNEGGGSFTGRARVTLYGIKVTT